MPKPERPRGQPRSANIRVRAGPDLDHPFVVLEGVAVIRTVNSGVPVPAGCVWPGLPLPPDLQAHLQPVAVELFPGTVLGPADPGQLDLARANLRALALLYGTVHDRLRMLPRALVVRCNQSTLAAALDVARESVNQALQALEPP